MLAVTEEQKQAMLIDVKPEPKRNRHVVIALSHMNKRREALLAKRAALTKEIEELDAAILALE